jgi:hypothetical protein
MKRASRFAAQFNNAGQRDALAAGDPGRLQRVQTPGSIGNSGLSPQRFFSRLFLSVTFRMDGK